MRLSQSPLPFYRNVTCFYSMIALCQHHGSPAPISKCLSSYRIGQQLSSRALGLQLSCECELPPYVLTVITQSPTSFQGSLNKMAKCPSGIFKDENRLNYVLITLVSIQFTAGISDYQQLYILHPSSHYVLVICLYCYFIEEVNKLVTLKKPRYKVSLARELLWSYKCWE